VGRPILVTNFCGIISCDFFHIIFLMTVLKMNKHWKLRLYSYFWCNVIDNFVLHQTWIWCHFYSGVIVFWKLLFFTVVTCISFIPWLTWAKFNFTCINQKVMCPCICIGKPKTKISTHLKQDYSSVYGSLQFANSTNGLYSNLYITSCIQSHIFNKNNILNTKQQHVKTNITYQ